MITRLQVRNFKSLREINLPLGALNVLVGPNMAGKTLPLPGLLPGIRDAGRIVCPRSTRRRK